MFSSELCLNVNPPPPTVYTACCNINPFPTVYTTHSKVNPLRTVYTTHSNVKPFPTVYTTGCNINPLPAVLQETYSHLKRPILNGSYTLHTQYDLVFYSIHSML